MDDSGADEDSNMASLVFLTGGEGLHTNIENISDSYDQQSKQSENKAIKHKALPIRKSTFLRSHSYTSSLSHAFECNHATLNCTSLSKHRQTKEGEKGRKKGSNRWEKSKDKNSGKFARGVNYDAALLSAYSHMC